jgi:hypothetical protein
MLIIILFLIFSICKYLYKYFYYFIVKIEDNKGNTKFAYVFETK